MLPPRNPAIGRTAVAGLDPSLPHLPACSRPARLVVPPSPPLPLSAQPDRPLLPAACELAVDGPDGLELSEATCELEVDDPAASLQRGWSQGLEWQCLTLQPWL